MFVKNRQNLSQTLPLSIAIALVVAAAIYGFYLRQPYIGTLSYHHHQWVTASSMLFAENWWYDGFLNDHGLMLEIPKSINEPDIAQRLPYVTYMPGAFLEIFALKSLFPATNTLALIHTFNMVNQWIIASCMLLLVWILMPHISHTLRAVFSCVAALTYMLHPGAMYWHSMVFFADQAVLVYVALSLLCEAWIRSHAARLPAHADTLLALLVALAVAMDWLGLVLACVLCLFRLIAPVHQPKQLAAVAWLMAGPLLLLMLWAGEVYSTGDIDFVIGKWIKRTSLGLSFADRLNALFGAHPLFGHIKAVDAIALYLAFFYFSVRWLKNKKDVGATIIMISYATCMLHAMIFAQHTQVHDFSALKFMTPLTFAAYGLLPLSIINHLRKHPYIASVCAAMLALLIAAVGLPAHSKWQDKFPPARIRAKPIADWLREHGGPKDIFIGKNFSIGHFPPQLVAMSRHLVYGFSTVQDMRVFLSRQKPDAALYAIITQSDAAACPAAQGSLKGQVQVKENWYIIALGSPPLSSNWENCLISYTPLQEPK